MNIKILYIIPPYYNYEEDSMTNILPMFTIPYGIMSIDSYLKSNLEKVESNLLDFNVEIKKTQKYDIRILKDRMSEFKPNVVAISALFNTSYIHLEKISNIVKECSNLIFVVAGGGLPTNLYEKVLNECPNIDAICYGEGEIPMFELLLNLDSLSNFKHQSWITKESLKEGVEPINSFVHDLDKIPEFDYKLVNLDDYNNRSLDKEYANKVGKREMSIHTSRGCPFNCVFCANGRIHGRKVRYMSVERVMNEINNMIKIHNMTTLMIEDDHFLSDVNRAKEILKMLHCLNIRVEFPNGIALYAIDKEIGYLLKEAGVTSIALAVESGSDYVLKNIINKPHTSKMIKPVVEILRKNNISVQSFIVIGLPGETDENRLETLNMLKDVGFDWTHVFIAIPIVGSRLYDICVENGYILSMNDEDKMKNHIISKCNIKTPTINPFEIEKIAYMMNLDVNFVNNYNMKHGNYEKARVSFENVTKKYPNHAFAHYFLSKLYKDKSVLRISHMKSFVDIVSKDSEWKKYSEHFELT